jgi:hypothetical protein
MFASLGLEFDARVLSALHRPSRTTRQTGRRPLDGPEAAWTNALTTAQIERILDVVRGFGLDHIYGDSIMPLERPAGTVVSTSQ